MNTKMLFTDSFESRVRSGLAACGVSVASGMHNFASSDSNNTCRSARTGIGAAVSGGADSISLVTALHRILPKDIPLYVITINHNLRPEEETAGDASFVESYCQSLGVPCTRVEIPRGRITALAEERGMGVEEAARLVRYEAFASFCEEKKIGTLCVAHNKNDQIETVVMRFLRGSSALAGIPRVRTLCKDVQIVRPLIDIPRADIERYLSELHVSFRTDKTNFDTAMMRNAIRNKVMPLLDGEMPGWQNAVCTLAEKARDDEEAVQVLVQQGESEIDWKIKRRSSGNEVNAVAAVSFSDERFARLLPAVQRRIVYLAIEEIGAEERVPYQLVDTVCRCARERWCDVNETSGTKETTCMKQTSGTIEETGVDVGTSCVKKTARKEEGAGIEVTVDGGRITVQKKAKHATESGFFVIIKEIGEYQAGPYVFRAVQNEDGAGVVISEESESEHDESFSSERTIVVPKASFPFCIRSKQPGDEIKTASGSLKSVTSILENCHAGANSDRVPLIQNLGGAQQNIVCIWGSLLGYDDWIVKE